MRPSASVSSGHRRRTGPRPGRRCPAGPAWMWAKIGGAILVQARAKQTPPPARLDQGEAAPVGVAGAGGTAGPVQPGAELGGQVEVEVAGAVELASDGSGPRSRRCGCSRRSRGMVRDPPGQGRVDVDAAGDRGEGVGQRGGIGARLEEQHHDGAGHARPTFVDVGGRGGADLRPLSGKAARSPARVTKRAAAPVGGRRARAPRWRRSGGRTAGDLAGGGGGGGGEEWASPSNRAVTSATAVTRFRIRLLLGSSGATGQRATTDGAVRFPC